jgi:hypothetical protein
MNKQLIHSINYFGDFCACGWYRMGWPSNMLKTRMNSRANSNIHFRTTDTETLIPFAQYYMSEGGVRLVRIQRWFGWDKLKFIKEFLKPLSEQIGFHICYEIDDVLVYDDIPKYNLARETFHPEKIGDSVKQIMDLCDIITVSTETLKQFYVRKLNINPNKVLVIQNYLPRWWIGDSMNIDRQMAQYKQQRYKPSLAFCCSTNHFDIKNENGGVDDFTHLIPWIIRSMNKYNFIFVGGVPQQLMEFVKAGKIQYQPPSDIFNYPHEMQIRKIDLLIAPLIDNEFNRCKSNIKFLEFSALGIPMCGQNISTYNQYTKLVFNNGDDIDKLCQRLFFNQDSPEFYNSIIKQQRALIDKPSVLSPNGYWLESNIQAYYDLYSLPQKTVTIKI